MLLNDSVSNRQTQAGSFARTLRGEEWIVNLVQIFGANACAGIADIHAGTRFLAPRTHLESPAALHGVARVEEQVEEYLLQFAGVAVDRPQLRIEFGVDLYACLGQLMLQQRERFLN